MPVVWETYTALPEVQQVFGVYGVKRKTEENSDSANWDKTNSEEVSCKRLCTWTGTISDNVQTPNHTQTVTSTVCMDSTETTEITTPGNREDPLKCQQQSHDMIMNINEDDSCAIDDYLTACEAMDSEGAADPSQYGVDSNKQHEAHCFGAEHSPNSGRLRCYCRPSWENMRDINAFFSDIY